MRDAILFDFDGTLADSVGLMVQAMNTLAPAFGFTPIESEEMPKLRALTVKRFLTERLRIPLWRLGKLHRLEREAKAEFEKHAGTLRLFPGIQEMLAELRINAYTMGIVSSAPRSVIERVCYDSGVTVDLIEAGSGTFGKARAIKRALSREGISRDRAIYVGDELRDLDASTRAGIPMLGVAWGLNDARTLEEAGLQVASTPQELFSMLTA